MSNISPKAEPVTWAVVIATGVAALASYGLNITNELGSFLVMVGPYLAAALVVRFSVFAPDTVQEEVDIAARTGVANKV